MILDIEPMIAEFGQSIDVYTYSNGEYVDGYWVEGTPNKTTILAPVYALSGQDLRIDFNGANLGGMHKFYSKEYFPLSNYQEVAYETRVVCQLLGSPIPQLFKVVHRFPWKDYYRYYMELLRVQDELPE